MENPLIPVDELAVLKSAAARPPRRFLLPFLTGFVVAVVGCYWAADLLELRFCQPFTFSESNKVYYFQKHVVDPEVVFVGSSQILFGVMPEVFEQECSRLGRPIARSHNLGVLAGDLAICKVLARDTLTGRRKPQTVVLGILPHLMFESVANQDRLYCYARPSDLAQLAWQGNVPWRLAVGASFRGIENLIQWPIRSGHRPDRKFRDEFLTASRGGYWTPADESIPREPVFDKEWKKLVTRMGKPVVGSYRDDSPAVQHLADVMQWAEKSDVELIVVLPPQHPDYIKAKLPSAPIEQFDAWCAQYCGVRDVRYLNLMEPDSYQDADFRDPLHLAASGAAKFSRHLAEVLSAPESYPTAPRTPPEMARSPERTKTQ